MTMMRIKGQPNKYPRSSLQKTMSRMHEASPQSLVTSQSQSLRGSRSEKKIDPSLR
jgi:hypothetical protein